MPKDKKRKREKNGKFDKNIPKSEVDTSKPSALFKATGGRQNTLSIALPGSIISNAKSHDQKTYLAGTIARALAVFCVDEIVIFDDGPNQTLQNTSQESSSSYPTEEEYTAFSDPCHFLAHVLSFLETPPHLRKTLFPMHPNLRTAGNLPSLDMPHHLRINEYCEYREGVTTTSSSNDEGTMVDIGLGDPVLLPNIQIPSKVRVTVQLSSNTTTNNATAVSPSEPRESKGYYWGYTIRRCKNLSSIFTETPFDGGYDLSFGTSERGVSLSSILQPSSERQPSNYSYNHMIIIFGGVAGLEFAAKNDPELQQMGITPNNVGELFDHYINLLPGQGSRTIRTEEAVWLGLMGLKSIIDQNGV